MIEQYLGISTDKLVKAGWETLYMVGFSLIIGAVVGFLIAIVLWLTRKGGLKENRILYTILNGFINVVRSTPFIILLVCVMPVIQIHRRNPHRNQGSHRSTGDLYRPIFSKTAGKLPA